MSVKDSAGVRQHSKEGTIPNPVRTLKGVILDAMKTSLQARVSILS
jgi:hypothetical protein